MSPRTALKVQLAPALLLATVVVGCGPTLPDGGPGDPEDGGADPLSVSNLGPHELPFGVEARVPLQGDGGTPPYLWAVVTKAPEVSWADIEAESGVIFGVPPAAYAAPAALKVRLADSAGRALTADVLIRATPCVDGARRPCASSNSIRCLTGEQVCANGTWPPEGENCVDMEESSDPNRCGPTCAQCQDDALQCSKGLCVCAGGTGPCSSGETCCTSSGSNTVCVNTLTSSSYCGDCNTKCTTDDAHATAICSGGKCASACTAPFIRCPEASTGDCLIDSNASELHCGECNRPCPAENDPGPKANQHYTGRCSGGACQFACNEGWDDCDGNPDNGCETNILGSDVQHCGSCTKVCTDEYWPPGSELIGQPVCNAGACGWDCGPEGRMCPAGAAGQCRRYTNLQHCGSCGNTCVADASKNVAAVTCAAGTPLANSVCKVTVCLGSFQDCNGEFADGCEADTDTSQTHCGTCGNGCGANKICNLGICENRP